MKFTSTRSSKSYLACSKLALRVILLNLWLCISCSYYQATTSKSLSLLQRVLKCRNMNDMACNMDDIDCTMDYDMRCKDSNSPAGILLINLNISDCLCNGTCNKVFNRLNIIGGLLGTLVALSLVLSCLLCCLVCFVIRQIK